MSHFNRITTSSRNRPQRQADKAAIVAGASSGLGPTIALACTAQGTHLMLCADLEPEAATGEEEDVPIDKLIE